MYIVNPDCFVFQQATGTQHILITGTNSQVVIVGGNVVDVNGSWTNALTFSEIQIDDNSHRSMLLNAMTRCRLPRLEDSDRSGLSQLIAGDVIYNRTDNKIQFYNGSNWLALPPPQQHFIAPEGLRQTNGSSVSPTSIGTYPDEYVYLSLDESPAQKPQGFGGTWQIADSWVPGSDIGVKVWLHAPSTSPLRDGDAILRFHYTPLDKDGTDSITATSTTLSKTVEVRLATGSGGDINSGGKAYLIELGTIAAASLERLDCLRFNLDRNTNDANDTYDDPVGLGGIVLEY